MHSWLHLQVAIITFAVHHIIYYRVMDPLQNQDNSETNVTLVILDHTYIITPRNISRTPAFIVHHSRLSEACIENGPHSPNEMVTGRPLTSVNDNSLEDNEQWDMSVEEEGPFLPDELVT